MESTTPAAVKAATASTAMEAPASTAMETTTTTAVESTTAPAAVESSSASTTNAVTAALCECGIGRERKNRESSERDEGSNLTKDAHNLTFPSSVVTDFQLQCLRMSSDPRVGKAAETLASRGNRHYERCSWSANGRLNRQ